MCEEFVRKNDFKLNALETFFSDHMTTHLLDLQDCMTGKEISQLPTTVEKDRHFIECSRKWQKNLRENVSQEFEMKARTLLGPTEQL